MVACGDKSTTYITNAAPTPILPPGLDTPVVIDSDGDGLSDEDELTLYRTNPFLYDTDGDGFSDGEEVLLYGFSEYNNLRFNPRIADLPHLEIELVAPPEVGLYVENTSGSVETVSNSSSNATYSSTSTSSTNSSSTAIENSSRLEVDAKIAGAHASAGAGISTGVPFGRVGPSASTTVGAGQVKVNYTLESTTTSTRSFSYSDAQSQGNSNTAEHAESLARNTGSTVKGGYINVTLDAYNTSNVAFTLSSFLLSTGKTVAHTAGHSEGMELVGIGNLALDATSSFPSVSIAPGGALRGLVFSKKDLPTDVALPLLANSDSLLFQHTFAELIDASGVPFSHRITEAETKTATLIIEYDPPMPIERYRVATRAVPDRNYITAAEVLDLVKIPYVTGKTPWSFTTGEGDDEVLHNETFQGLLSLRGIGTQAATSARWIVHHATFNGNEGTLFIHDNLRAAFNFGDIQLRAGDVLRLTYINDADQDGIFTREELLRRTNPQMADTDGDGIPDGEELEPREIQVTLQSGEVTLTVYSDPTRVDTDGDGLSDYEELLLDLNPQSADTDGDGILDAYDNEPAIYNETDISALAGVTDDVEGNIDLSWLEPDLDGLNISDYKVMFLRHDSVPASVAQPAVFKELSQLPINHQSYAPGTQFRCADGSDCYTVVFFGRNTQLSEGEVLSVSSATRYIAFVRIEGVWRRSSQSVTVARGVGIARLKATFKSYRVYKCLDGTNSSFTWETKRTTYCRANGTSFSPSGIGNPNNSPNSVQHFKLVFQHPVLSKESMLCDMNNRLRVNGVDVLPAENSHKNVVTAHPWQINRAAYEDFGWSPDEDVCKSYMDRHPVTTATGDSAPSYILKPDLTKNHWHEGKTITVNRSYEFDVLETQDACVTVTPVVIEEDPGKNYDTGSATDTQFCRIGDDWLPQGEVQSPNISMENLPDEIVNVRTWVQLEKLN